MPKHKSVKFESNAPGPVTVHVYGHPKIELDPGKSFETDDPRLVEALKSNSDLSVVKGK